jgi:hypothetical protein
MNKHQAIEKLNTSLDKALLKFETRETKKLEKEIIYLISNSKTETKEIGH